MTKNITIVGAGLVGSLAAIYLAKRGHQVAVYEYRPDLRHAELVAGKSINLALSERGWKALKAVGIDEEVRRMAIPMSMRMMHAVDGALAEQPYGQDGQAIYSVSRAGLNAVLMDLAEQQNNVQLHFQHRCADVDLQTAAATFEQTQTSTLTQVEADVLIGADGTFSAVRNKMMRQDRFQYSQQYIEHGYKELTIPPAADGSHRMYTHALHIWPRGNYMLIALPNLDGSFTCTLFFPFEGESSFASLQTGEDVLRFFNHAFPDVVPHMPALVSDYMNNPTSSMAIIRCNPWTVKDKVLLIGDAAHATIPFYGQGMNAGFEDCLVLNRLLDQHGDNWEACFDHYTRLRKPDGDSLQDLSMDNFIVMRDKTADPKFLLQKKIELKFSKTYPDKWLPLYSMVTFSDTRYSDAWKIGQQQEELMQQIMAIPNIEAIWDSEDIEQRILRLIG